MVTTELPEADGQDPELPDDAPADVCVELKAAGRLKDRAD